MSTFNPLAVLAAQQQRDAQFRLEQQARDDRNIALAIQLLNEDPSVNIDNLMDSSTSLNARNSVREIQKIKKAQAKKAEEAAKRGEQETRVKQLGALRGLGAPTDEVASRLGPLIASQPTPEARRDLAGEFAFSRLAAEEGRRIELADADRAADRERVRNLQDEAVATLAEIRAGVLRGDIPADIGDEQVARRKAELVRRHGPIAGANAIEKELLRADRRAVARLSELARTERSQAGPTDKQRLMEAGAKAFEAMRNGEDPSEVLTPEEQFRLAEGRHGFRDPAQNGRFVMFPASPEMIRRRQALATINPLVNENERLANEVVRGVAAGTAVAGGVAGTDLVQRALRLTGKQSAPVAAFVTNSQALLIKIARMDQDARLSDFDLTLWMGAIPNLIDLSAGFDEQGNPVLTPQAQGRYDALRRLVELEINTMGVSQEARDIRARLSTDSEVQRRVRILESHLTEDGTLTPAAARRAVKEINQGSPGGVGVTTLTPAEEHEFEQFLQ